MVKQDETEEKTKSDQSRLRGKRSWAKLLPPWAGPALFLGLFILTFLTFLGLLRAGTHTRQHKDLVNSAETAAATIRQRLEGTSNYLLLIAKERSEGLIDSTAFQRRGSWYVASHPELICINWVDANFFITDVAPFAANQQVVGLRLDLPEPKRASHLAMVQRQPVYTRPFEVIQGELAFEQWVPVFRGEQFLGLFGGVFSYEKLLRLVADDGLRQTNDIGLVDGNGKFVLRLPGTGPVDARLVHQVPLPPAENGFALRLSAYRAGLFGWSLRLAELLCLALLFAMTYAMWGLRREIRARERADEGLRRLNREFRAISACNQLLVRAEDEQSLLNEICRIVCEDAGYRMAWVGFAEKDEGKTIRPVAWAGVEDGYLEKVRLTWADTEHGRGPTGMATRSGARAGFLDFTTDELAAPWRESALARGYRSSIALPLKDDDGHTFGVLTIYSAEPNAFSEEEVRLLEELAGDLAFGITVRRTRAQRKIAEEALLDAQEVFRALVENSPDIIARYDLNFRRTYVNPTYLKEAKIPKRELLQSTPVERSPLPEASAVALQELLQRVLKSGAAEAIDVAWPRPDRPDCYYNIYAFPEHGRDGQVVSVMTVSRDITERRRAEQERLIHLRALESLDRVNRAMRETDDLDKMMGDVLQAVLEIFDCDRAWLAYPCDPDAPSWWAPMERTKPEYPGANALGVEIPMDPAIAEAFRAVLAADGAVTFGGETGRPLPADVAERFGFKSFMGVALFPKLDKPWQFGVHQCAYAREWTVDEQSLLQEIGRRLTDGLTGLLASRNLRNSEGNLQTLLRTIPDLVWLKDDAGVYLACNAMFERFFGTTAANIIGKTDYDFVDKELADFFREHDRKSVIAGRPSVNEEWLTFADNGYRGLFETIKTPMFDATGQLTGVLGIARDITERRAAAQSIRKLSEVIEQCPVSIVITDDQGNIEFVNRKFTQVSGYSRSEAMGQNPRILKSGETRKEDYERLWATITSGKAWTGEFHNRRKNGELFWEQASIAPIRDADNAITHYVAVKEDISERRALEDQLRHAQKMEAVGTLAGGVAHDFNNILTAIMGCAYLLAEDAPADAEHRGYVDEIIRATQRASNLTRSLLAFSRKQVVNLQPAGVNEIVFEFKKMLGRLIGEDVTFTVNLAVDDMTIEADRGQIEQVLMNLVANSRDAMPHGGTLEIRTHREEIADDSAELKGLNSGGFGVITVVDTGTGMPPEVAQRIFEPFFTTKDVGKGTGLGLSMVHGIVKTCLTG